MKECILINDSVSARESERYLGENSKRYKVNLDKALFVERGSSVMVDKDCHVKLNPSRPPITPHSNRQGDNP